MAVGKNAKLAPGLEKVYLSLEYPYSRRPKEKKEMLRKKDGQIFGDGSVRVRVIEVECVKEVDLEEIKKSTAVAHLVATPSIKMLAGYLEKDVFVLAEEIVNVLGIDKSRKADGFDLISAFASITGKVLESSGNSSDVHVKFDDRFPTLGKWSRENTKKVAFVRSGQKIALVAMGVVVMGQILQSNKITHEVVMMEVNR